MDEISLESVKSRSVRGIVVLTGRTFLLQAVSLVAQLFLFAYLGQYEFGIFAIVSAIVNFLTYFSDIGLAAALIQKKESPTQTDLATTFTIQQGLILLLLSMLFIFSGQIASYYQLTTGGLYLMYALGISLFLSSLKSIPSVLLERKLEFVKLVFPQILEQVVYNIVLVIMAMQGFGITSFTVAVLVRSVLGLVVIYLIEPWRPRIELSISTVKDLFKFGIPYQLNTLLATFKDDGMTIVLGQILGPVGIGILSFAQKVGRYPLTFFMDTVTKVTFPAFARLQHEPDQLKRSVTRSIFFICLLVFPSLVGIIILMPMVTDLIPRYSKWSTAIIPLIFVSINYGFAAMTTQLTNLLNSIGKIKITFYLMIMWTILTWIFVPFLAIKYGVNGAAIGYSLVGLSSVFAIFFAKKYVDFSIVDSLVKPLISTFIMAVVLLLVKKHMPTDFLSLQILILVGILSYGVAIISMVGVSLVEDAKKSFKTIFNR